MNPCHGNPTVQVVTVWPYLSPILGFSTNWVGTYEPPESGVLSYNLSHRGITSLHPNAFECWAFPNDDDQTANATGMRGGLRGKGIILDGNPLGAIPNGATFQEAPCIWMRGCGLTSIPPFAFASYNYTGSYSSPSSPAFLYLEDNDITTIAPSAFAGIQVHTGDPYAQMTICIYLNGNPLTTGVTAALFDSGSVSVLDLTETLVWATPMVANFPQTDSPEELADNMQGWGGVFLPPPGRPLACLNFWGGAAHNCSCAPGYALSEFCGYYRCLGGGNHGCPDGTVTNLTNCSDAPLSVCVGLPAHTPAPTSPSPTSPNTTTPHPTSMHPTSLHPTSLHPTSRSPTQPNATTRHPTSRQPTPHHPTSRQPTPQPFDPSGHHAKSNVAVYASVGCVAGAMVVLAIWRVCRRRTTHVGSVPLHNFFTNPLSGDTTDVEADTPPASNREVVDSVYEDE
eukprot:m.204239 g.204239  ORF g.204239 m.204239 type:complete len:454 (-) comp25310_c0_seq1:118-1479(-)